MPEIIDEAERNILDISQRRTDTAFLTIKDVLMDTYERIEMPYTRAVSTGIPTGFPDLDRMTSGTAEFGSDHRGGPAQCRKNGLCPECSSKRGPRTPG